MSRAARRPCHASRSSLSQSRSPVFPSIHVFASAGPPPLPHLHPKPLSRIPRQISPPAPPKGGYKRACARAAARARVRPRERACSRACSHRGEGFVDGV
eukprot:4097604-Pleurochrysis_carterae.AAC.1